MEDQCSVKGHPEKNVKDEKMVMIKECSYHYCNLNEIKNGKICGICTATKYRYERCRNRVKKWLNGRR